MRSGFRLVMVALAVALSASNAFAADAPRDSTPRAYGDGRPVPLPRPRTALSASPIALRSGHSVAARAVVDGWTIDEPSCATIALYRLERGAWVVRKHVATKIASRAGTHTVLTASFVPPSRGRWSARLRLVSEVTSQTVMSAPAGFVVVGPRWVALTFDDGPSSSATRRVLSVLKSRSVKATFFMLGGRVNGAPAIARSVRDAGQEIGDHSWSHPMLASCSSSRVRSELSRTKSVVRATCGVTPRFFRPPGGSTSSRVRSIAASLGLRQVLWTVDPKDWRNPPPSTIRRRVLGAVRSGGIVLLHDGGGNRRNTVSALPGILDTLRDRDYYLVTMSEWQVLRGSR